MNVCLSVCASDCPSDCPSLCLSVRLTVCPSVCLTVCLSVCLFVPHCLSACGAVCMSVCIFLSVCMSSWESRDLSFVRSVSVWLTVCLLGGLSVCLKDQSSLLPFADLLQKKSITISKLNKYMIWLTPICTDQAGEFDFFPCGVRQAAVHRTDKTEWKYPVHGCRKLGCTPIQPDNYRPLTKSVSVFSTSLGREKERKNRRHHVGI